MGFSTLTSACCSYCNLGVGWKSSCLFLSLDFLPNTTSDGLLLSPKSQKFNFFAHVLLLQIHFWSRLQEVIDASSRKPWEALRPDGVIIFSDILTPLPAFGVPFDIEEVCGPVIRSPIRSELT
ncbi:unnamed protein product [Fraxinus pennsylvanica]|uniref:Uroporphyrinogen decarboxylase (URO-D) domain-containing protein n=1 Tax=Fraxinus pennsylvanica TaxID=56036 RepID=A0AAD2AA51_9LAMI|nr:unnamed protein product [Fraxinus pennsylvanica]